MHQLAKKFRTTGQIRHVLDRVSGPAITVVLSLVAMAQALKVWQWRPGDPMATDGDANFVTMQIKDLLDHGWYGHNEDVGAPFGQDASLYPHADHIHLLVVRLIGFFSDNPFTVGALYFMLGFPLAALTMYWLARQRRVGRLGSIVAGVLFSVLPGHQTMFQHLWLASYWVIPLGMWLVLRASMGEPLFLIKFEWQDPVQRRLALRLDLTTAFCVLIIASGGIYYSAFTLLLLAVSLGLRLVATRDRRSVVRAGLLLPSIAIVSLGAVLSVVAGQDKSAVVSTPAQRGFWESEVYAGKLMDLILPWIHHRVDAFQYLTAAYNSRTTPSLEQPVLGVVALAGVVALIVIILSTLVAERLKPVHSELKTLGLLSVIALSFFSIGGLGSFTALFVTSQIRSWSRLFVIIALLGLLAIAHWVTWASSKNRIFGVLAAIAVLLTGVLDQTNPAVAPNYKELRAEVGDLSAFSHRIEATVGPGCSVFQLPLAPFPDNTPVQNMAGYAHLRPFLTSSTLRWSYGAFDGTGLADWQIALPQRSTANLVKDVGAVGFCAIEVDRAGFPDHGKRLEGELSALLGTPIAATRDDRLVAWDLTRTNAALRSQMGAAQVSAEGQLVLHPLVVYSNQGAYEVDHNNETPYQWAGPSPEIDVHNFGRTTVNGVHLRFSLGSPDSASRRFTVHSPDGRTQVVDLGGGRTQQVEVVLDATPGPNKVAITTTDGGEALGNLPSQTQTDHRIVFGRLIDIRASVADPNVRVGVVQQRVG